MFKILNHVKKKKKRRTVVTNLNFIDYKIQGRYFFITSTRTVTNDDRICNKKTALQ